MKKRHSLEFEIEMDYVPYTVLAEGDTFAELIADAQYNYACSDNGNNYRSIDNLPGNKYTEVEQEIADLIATPLWCCTCKKEFSMESGECPGCDRGGIPLDNVPGDSVAYESENPR